MFTNTAFSFDGENSTDYGLMLVSINTDVENVPFGVEREIIEDKIAGMPIPYFFKVDESPLYFKATMAKKKELDYRSRVKIVKWLFKDEYKPFISLDHQHIVFNCMVVERSEKILVGSVPVAIELTFRCDAPWAWTPLFTKDYDLSDNTTNKIIIMKNKSNVEKYVYPEIWIKALEEGAISLKNNSDDGRETIIENLNINEVIYLNNRRKQIETDVANTYRLKDFNRNWLRLVYGVNKIGVSGKCLITTQMKHGIAL